MPHSAASFFGFVEPLAIGSAAGKGDVIQVTRDQRRNLHLLLRIQFEELFRLNHREVRPHEADAKEEWFALLLAFPQQLDRLRRNHVVRLTGTVFLVGFDSRPHAVWTFGVTAFNLPGHDVRVQQPVQPRRKSLS